MAENTKIEWATHTFNHVRGCTKVSAGCANCYAETLSHRNPGTLGVWGPRGTRVVAADAAWREPLNWDRKAKAAGERHRVFCASLADVFEDWRGDMRDAHGNKLIRVGPGTHTDPRSGAAWKAVNRVEEYDTRDLLTMQDVRERLFRLIDATPNLDWLLLTKRPENLFEMMPGTGWVDAEHQAWPVRPNVWLGTSVENQAAADERIPHLLRVPAAVRFLSCEPLLGPVDIREHLNGDSTGYETGGAQGWQTGPAMGWVIVGGESGPGARPMNPDWARSLRDQCQAAGVPFFFKQHGEWLPHPLEDWKDGHQLHLGERPDGSHVHVYRHGYLARKYDPREMRLLDGRVWDEFPQPAHR